MKKTISTRLQSVEQAILGNGTRGIAERVNHLEARMGRLEKMVYIVIGTQTLILGLLFKILNSINVL